MAEPGDTAGFTNPEAPRRVRLLLNDDEWDLIKDVFPKPAVTGRPRRDARTIVKGLLWILRTGSLWRDLPAEFGEGLDTESVFACIAPRAHLTIRADRAALDAVQAVHGLLNTGHREVVDADLSEYFDSIPHAELMQCIARR